MCGKLSQIHRVHSLFVCYKNLLVLAEQSIHGMISTQYDVCSNCCKMFNHFCNTVVVSQSVSACKSLSLVTWSLSWFSINSVCVIQTKKDI